MNEVITELTIRICPRCGVEHPLLPFRYFKRPRTEMDMWAMCPITGEPLLASIKIEKIEGNPLEYLQKQLKRN